MIGVSCAKNINRNFDISLISESEEEHGRYTGFNNASSKDTECLWKDSHQLLHEE